LARQPAQQGDANADDTLRCDARHQFALELRVAFIAHREEQSFEIGFQEDSPAFVFIIAEGRKKCKGYLLFDGVL
jgi:hypothetical protein